MTTSFTFNAWPTTPLDPSDLRRLIEWAGGRCRDEIRAFAAGIDSRQRQRFRPNLERPALASGVVLSGELLESGFQERQWLVQRNGRFLQVPELLYRVLEQLDGQRTLAAIADDLARRSGRPIRPEQIRQIIERKLAPAGLARLGETPATPTPQPVRAPRRSLLMVRLRRQLFGPRFIEPMARVLQVLYWPPLLMVALVAIALGHGWLYAIEGIDTSLLQQVAARPDMMLTLLILLMLASMVHEFGHAAALRYGGGHVRGIGAGLYLFYPVFYTDVTDAYRLGRWERVRSDLGGFYFHLLLSVGLIGLYAGTGQDVLLLAVVLINIEVLHQSLPFLRLDGYWALADLVGIPDLFGQFGPYLRSVVPFWRGKGQRLPALKRWVKIAFGVYILVTIPALAIMGLQLLRAIPGTLTTAAHAAMIQGTILVAATRAQDGSGAVLALVQIIILTLTTLGLLLMLTNLTWLALSIIWRRMNPARLRTLAKQRFAVVKSVRTSLHGCRAFVWSARKPSASRLPVQTDCSGESPEGEEPILVREYWDGPSYDIDALALFRQGWLIRHITVHPRPPRLPRWLTLGLIDRLMTPRPRRTVTYVYVGLPGTARDHVQPPQRGAARTPEGAWGLSRL